MFNKERISLDLKFFLLEECEFFCYSGILGNKENLGVFFVFVYKENI